MCAHPSYMLQWASTRCQHCWGGGCTMRSLSEQVSILGHQMSLGGGWGPVQGGRALYSAVQWIRNNGHMDPSLDRHDWKHCLPAISLTGGKNMSATAIDIGVFILLLSKEALVFIIMCNGARNGNKHRCKTPGRNSTAGSNCDCHRHINKSLAWFTYRTSSI